MFNKSVFENIVNNANHILISAHILPDADAICAVQLMRHLLDRQFGRDCDICIADNVGKLLVPFAKNLTPFENLTKKYDLVIACDSADISRLGKIKPIFVNSKKTINIDHHESNPNYADLNIVDKKASSTCELIYNICLKHYPDIIDLQIANLTYAGIITDTNGLMANNLQARTFLTIADIMNRGLNIDIIKNYFFKSFSKAKLQLLGKALNSITFYNSNRTAVIIISKQDFINSNASFNDTLGIIDYALNCYLTDIAIAVIESEHNKFYVSLRSKKTDVSTIAKEFGGGGNPTMAAFQYNGEQSDFMPKLIDICGKTTLTNRR